MSINDGTYGEFDNELQDEDQLDAHPAPGIEIGYDIQRDCGSGSYAEDGRREVREDRPIMDGENLLGSAAMYGPTEIGDGPYAQRGASEIGGPYAADGAVEIGAGEDTLGHDALMQPFESFMLEDERIGAAAAADRPGSELGSAAMYGPTEIGNYAERGASELGNYAERGASELGNYAERGASELGAGLYPVDGASELGAGLYPTDGASEIGENQGEDEWGSEENYWASTRSEIGVKAAVVKVVEKARDNRQPAPPMKAVDVDAPLEDDNDFLSEVVIGAAVVSDKNEFPLLAQLLQRAGAGMEPRIVRVDTEESYKEWRADQSPALAQVRELREKIEAHIADPNAHELDSQDIDDDIEDLVHLGEEAKAVEAQKRVDLWMPERFQGKVEAWRQDDMICASLAIPGRDGSVRICTSFEPVRKCVEEMVKHAHEANVSDVVGAVLPAMGCVLGAGTVMKEVAAAAPAILARPEAQVKLPFVVRIEPKTSPNLAALVMLAYAAKKGSTQAVSEWQKLAAVSPPAIRLAMTEAAQVAKAATEG